MDKDEPELEVTCNRCKIVYTDVFETQEMLRWKDTGGYASIWGDGNRISLDLCQKCCHELFKDFIVIEPDQ